MAKLQDKTALITGASSGIGAKVALLFADEGADVAVNYPDEGQAENALAVVAEVEKRGRRAVAIKAAAEGRRPPAGTLEPDICLT